MKNNKTGIAFIATGILIGSAFGGGTALAASGVLAERSTMPFIVNGAPMEVEAYLIEGNNYLKLRDIAALADFGVFWNEGSGTVSIDTMVGYTPEARTQTQENEKISPLQLPQQKNMEPKRTLLSSRGPIHAKPTTPCGVKLRPQAEVLHDPTYLATGSHKQTQPDLTRFAKELLVPGSTK